MTPEPRVAVVIPTRGRETRLAFALEALGRQTLPRDCFEVIVVRDGPASGPTAKAPDGLQVRFMTTGKHLGPPAARNLGWRSSAAATIAFTDDDCRPRPDWLKNLVASSSDGVVVQGATEPDPDEARLLYGLARSQTVPELSPWHPTCNIAYRRTMLESLGGFDEALPAGDDTDLGWRSQKAGARHVFEPAAVVHHAVHPRSLQKALSEASRWSTNPELLHRHPELREHVYRRVFWRRSHALLLLLIAGWISPYRRQLGPVASIPYIRSLFDWHRPTPSRLVKLFAWVLPTRLTIDLFEVATTARAAMRRRVWII